MSSTFFLAQHAESGRVAVNVGRSLHGTDLSVAKEPAERNVTDDVPEHFAVVIGSAVEVLASPETREQQCAASSSTGQATFAETLFEHGFQIIRAAPTVAEMELHLATESDFGADREAAGLGVVPGHVADQIVAVCGLGRGKRIHRDPEEQRRRLRQVEILTRQIFQLVLQELHRRHVVDGEDMVVFDLGEAPDLAEGFATLGDDGLDHDVAGEDHRDGALLVDRLIDEEDVFSGVSRTTDESPDL